MSTPILEYIASNIASTINGVTILKGYNQDLVAVRPKRQDWYNEPAVDGKVLVVQDNDDPADEKFLGTHSWNQPFLLICFVIDSDAATLSIDTRMNQVKSDIRKILMDDVTRGGYAIETMIGGSVKFDNGEGWSGVALEITVYYRTSEMDPYTKG